MWSVWQEIGMNNTAFATADAVFVVLNSRIIDLKYPL